MDNTNGGERESSIGPQGTTTSEQQGWSRPPADKAALLRRIGKLEYVRQHVVNKLFDKSLLKTRVRFHWDCRVQGVKATQAVPAATGAPR
jgi:hypothetical protein